MSFKLQLISVAFNDIRCILKFDSLLGGGGLELFESLIEFNWLANIFGKFTTSLINCKVEIRMLIGIMQSSF